MRKIFLVALAFLLIPAVCLGQKVDGVSSPAKVGGVAGPAKVAGVGLSGAVWSCADAGLTCDSFDTNPGFDASWSTTGTPDPDYPNSSALACDAANVHSFRINKTDDGTIQAYTTLTEQNTYNNIYFLKLESSSNDTTRRIMVRLENDVRLLVDISQYVDGGNYYLAIKTSQQDESPVEQATYQVTLNAFYKIETHWLANQASGGVSVTINDLPVSLGNTSTYNGGVKYETLRADGTGATSHYAFQIDNWKSSATAPPVCAGSY